MKIGIIRLALAVGLISILAACGGLDNVSGTTVGTGEHSVVVTNGTGTRICFLFLLEEGVTQLSQELDYLGETGVLEANGSITIKVDAGTYNGLAITQDTDGGCDDDTGTEIDNFGFVVDGDEVWRLEL